MRTVTLIAMALALSSCGDERAPNKDTSQADTAEVSDTGAPDVDDVGDTSDTAQADTAAPDTGPTGDVGDVGEVSAPPNISEALDCGRGPATGPGNSNELQRFEVDTTKFPDAICNNGEAAVFYYRPYVGEANKDKWLINLNGGGGCAGGAGCAARWCWCQSTEGPNGCPFAETTTNFSMGNMDADERASIEGSGIFLRGDGTRPNPLGDYNQIRLVYCSSDAWSGTRRAVPLTAKHPKTGVDVAFSIHFLGSRIIDAVLTVLRQDGQAGPRYTFGANPRDLPDLDEADEVVLTGDSAGGAGVIANLDRVNDLLREHNTACQGASCPLVVRGLADAIVGPELARLEFDESFLAEFGGSTYADYLTYLASVPDKNQGSLADTSCVAWHQANDPAGLGECSDQMHIVRHHLTTPFFVRMALLDSLISGNYEEGGYKDPELGKMGLSVFARVLQRELAAFGDLPETAEEGDAMTVAPGVFAPACPKHDTIHDDGEVYRTSVTAGGTTWHLLELFENWRNGTDPSVITTMQLDRSDTFCAP